MATAIFLAHSLNGQTNIIDSIIRTERISKADIRSRRFSTGYAQDKRKVLDSTSKGVISVGNNKCLTRDFCKLYGLNADDIKRALTDQEHAQCNS